jgi:hypothetical protein
MGGVGHAEFVLAVGRSLEAEDGARFAVGALFVVQVAAADVRLEIRGAFPVAREFGLRVVEDQAGQGLRVERDRAGGACGLICWL